jgi:transcriptional regulator with XRE-family HTH domain
LRAARRAAGLSQAQLAERVNAATGRDTIDGNTISRFERGAIRRPGRQVRDALAAVLGIAAAELGFVRPVATSEPVAWAMAHGKATPEAVESLSGLLAATRRVEDTTGAAAALPALLHYTNLVGTLAHDAALSLRPVALELLNEFLLYRGWLRFALGGEDAARSDFDQGLVAAVEADSATGMADALSFRGYVHLRQGDPVAGASLVIAANRYERVPVNRRYLHLLTARCLASAGERADANRALAQADRVVVVDPVLNGRNYWYTDAWFTIQRGLVHAAAGESAAAVRALADGLSGMPADQRDAEWVRRYADLRDQLTSV